MYIFNYKTNLSLKKIYIHLRKLTWIPKNDGLEKCDFFLIMVIFLVSMLVFQGGNKFFFTQKSFLKQNPCVMCFPLV